MTCIMINDEKLLTYLAAKDKDIISMKGIEAGMMMRDDYQH